MGNEYVELKLIIQKNRAFIIPYLFALGIVAPVLFLYSKSESHLIINQYHNQFFDFYFQYVTYLGDGAFAVLACCVLLFISYRFTLLTAVANILSGLICQIVKHSIFPDAVRPKLFFQGVHELYFVPGVDVHLHNSFPSGHACSAFSIFFCFALYSDNQIYKFIYFLIAVIVAFSRVYLSQHFLVDIYFGSMIGVSVTLVVYYFIARSGKDWLKGHLSINKF